MQIKLIVVVVDCGPTSWTEPWKRASYLTPKLSGIKQRKWFWDYAVEGGVLYIFFMIIYLSFGLSILHVALKRLIDYGFV